jgi:hypothetical protein
MSHTIALQENRWQNDKLTGQAITTFLSTKLGIVMPVPSIYHLGLTDMTIHTNSFGWFLAYQNSCKIPRTPLISSAYQTQTTELDSGSLLHLTHPKSCRH